MKLLECSSVSKTFGKQRVLHDVSFSVERGTVHALAGANGAGKSTLIKILSGVHAPDRGAKVIARGKEVAFPTNSREIRAYGLATVQQDLGLVNGLSVTANLFSSRMADRSLSFVNWRRLHRSACETLRSYDIDLDPRDLVRDLAPADRALLAIVRAFEEIQASSGANDTVSAYASGVPRTDAAHRDKLAGDGILILDEPTAFLTSEESHRVLQLMRTVAKQGGAAVFVSHNLDEVKEYCDRVTVLRNGVSVLTAPMADLTADQLAHLMSSEQFAAVQETATAETRPSPSPGVPAVFTASGVSGRRLHGASLALHPGEIVGVAGLLGSGADELVYALFGLGGCTGSVRIGSDKYDLAHLTPRAAMSSGCVIVPADRRRQGLVSRFDITDNVTLGTINRYATHGMLRSAGRREFARDAVKEYRIKTAGIGSLLSSLSGGNQQKVLLAQKLSRQPRVVFLHEPTQGVDIESRQDLYRKLREMRAQGAATLVVSSDFDELSLLCDRILIMRAGVFTSELRERNVPVSELNARASSDKDMKVES